VNQRMEKLENRMALLDDIEGIIEAEKVALELERRDLYTARCRHWFGGA
jgi:SWI/SNF related-matrix-associated actin-dependent regulator of chromatin subfamily C